MLAATGFSGLTSTIGGVALSVAQTLALEGIALKITVPSGSKVTISDMATNIAAISASQIAGLGTLHVTHIAASDTNVALTVVQAAALESAGVPVAAPSGSHMTVSDTAAHLQTLTVAQINGLAAIGVSGLVSTNAAVRFTVAQMNALEGGHLSEPQGQGTGWRAWLRPAVIGRGPLRRHQPGGSRDPRLASPRRRRPQSYGFGPRRYSAADQKFSGKIAQEV